MPDKPRSTHDDASRPRRTRLPGGSRPPRFGLLVGLLAAWSVLVALGFGIGGQVSKGQAGLLSGLLGAGVTFVFCGTTAAVMWATRRKSVAAQSTWLVCSWLGKTLVLILALGARYGEDSFDKTWLGLAILTGLLGSLALDAWTVAKARVTTGDL